MLASPADGASQKSDAPPTPATLGLARRHPTTVLATISPCPAPKGQVRMTSIQHHPRQPSLGHRSPSGNPFSSFLPRSLGAARVGAGSVLLAALLAASGCPSPDAEGKYDRFNEQTEEDRDMPEPKMDFGAPVLPDAGSGETEGMGLDVDGVYLVAVNTIVSPGLPLQFVADVTAELDAMGNGTISVDFQPLSLDQLSTTVPREEVGDAITIEGDVSGFAFTLPFGEITVTGAANPITGADITADLALEGTIRSENAWCGSVTGMVLSPLMVDLGGSFFGATRLADRSERPLRFSCECATAEFEPVPTDPEGCILLP
jgi:hypothetical protein